MRITDAVTRRFIGAAFTLLFAATMTVPSLADTITIKGTNTTDDVSIFQEAPNASYSYWFYDYVGAYGGGAGVRRTLLRFDVSALAGQFTQITSIKLNLFPNSQDAPGNANVGILQVHQIAAANASWFEGTTQGGSAVPPESSWNFRNTPSTSWAGSAGLTTPGVDYTTLLGSASYDNTTPLNDINNPLGGGIGFSGGNAALTALINAWLTPGGNAGLLLRAFDEATADDRILKLNTADNLSPAAFYPELVVTFIPEPTTALLVLSGAILIWRRRSC